MRNWPELNRLTQANLTASLIEYSESEQFLLRLINAIDGLVFVCDEYGIVLFGNLSVAKWIEVDQDLVVKKNVSEIFGKSSEKFHSMLCAANEIGVAIDTLEIVGPVLTRTELMSIARINGLSSRRGNIFLVTSTDLTSILRETKEKERLKSELQYAEVIQSTFFPNQDDLNGWIEFSYTWQPAELCSGDLVTKIDVDEEKTIFCIHDVTGHGVGPALVTATADSVCRQYARDVAQNGELFSPDILLSRLNVALYDSYRGRMNLTCSVVFTDRAERAAFFAKGGHPPPMILRSSRDISQEIEVETINTAGDILGSNSSINFEVCKIDIQPEDKVLLYSDAAYESSNKSGRSYGPFRLRRAFKESSTLNPKETCKFLREKISEYTEGVKFDDDLTLIVFKFF